MPTAAYTSGQLAAITAAEAPPADRPATNPRVGSTACSATTCWVMPATIAGSPASRCWSSAGNQLQKPPLFAVRLCSGRRAGTCAARRAQLAGAYRRDVEVVAPRPARGRAGAMVEWLRQELGRGRPGRPPPPAARLLPGRALVVSLAQGAGDFRSGVCEGALIGAPARGHGRLRTPLRLLRCGVVWHVPWHEDEPGPKSRCTAARLVCGRYRT